MQAYTNTHIHINKPIHITHSCPETEMVEDTEVYMGLGMKVHAQFEAWGDTATEVVVQVAASVQVGLLRNVTFEV